MAFAAAGVGVLAFAYRLLTHRGLTNDHYMHLAWAQQLLVGELPVRDFVEPGMPLMYGLSAIVQAWLPGPFSEATLSAGLLGVAAAATCLAVTRLTGTLAWGIAASLVEAAIEPRLYAYPKVLAPAVAVLALSWFLERRTPRRAAVVGSWVAVCGLLRYDLGLYCCLAVLPAVAIAGPDARTALRTSAAAAGGVLAGAAPWVALVALSRGIGQHLAETFEFTRSETHQLAYGWPRFPMFSEGAMPGDADALAFFVYLAYALPPGIAALLAAQRRRCTRTDVAAGVSLALMLGLYLLIVLRHPLDVRIRDLAAPITLAGAWLGSTAWRTSRRPANVAFAWRPTLVGASVAVIAASTGIAAWSLGHVETRLDEARLLDGTAKVRDNLAGLRTSGSTWPWSYYWPAGDLPDAVPYLTACTSPADRILVTWNAPEYYFFSRRPFGGGHALLLPPHTFTRPADRQLMISRLDKHPPVIVLINETERPTFAAAYPEVDDYIRHDYADVGEFTIRDGSTITIGLRRDLRGRESYGDDAWPCTFEANDSPRLAAAHWHRGAWHRADWHTGWHSADWHSADWHTGDWHSAGSHSAGWRVVDMDAALTSADPRARRHRGA